MQKRVFNKLYKLKVPIIQLVIILGPQWGYDKPEQKLLFDAVQNSLLLADGLKCKSIAIPAISCGIFGGRSTLNESIDIIKKAIFDTIFEKVRGLEIVRVVSNDENIIAKLQNLDASFKKLMKKNC